MLFWKITLANYFIQKKLLILFIEARIGCKVNRTYKLGLKSGSKETVHVYIFTDR